ncbi:MAG: YggW family oxidoreductase, partial [Pseudomonadota bacterium]|nr:YggW family oxidoreductase [Pseudomonadota bacterium]
PGQSQAQALSDLEQAIALQPTHLSWYELTIEPNTVFYRSPPQQPDGDSMADTEEAGFALLAGHDYHRYEVSAFARPGLECRHNRNYWEFGDYLGIGAGAHSKLTQAADNAILRFQKTRKPEDYLANPAHSRRQNPPVTGTDRLFEALLNGLRLTGGISLQVVADRTGVNTAEWTGLLGELQHQGLLAIENGRIRCTDTGLRHLNGVLETLANAL